MKKQTFSTGAQRDKREGKGRFDLVTPYLALRLAKIYEFGATHYGDRNWEKGMPYSRFLDSALRHLNKFQRGLTDEDHLGRAVWNLACIIHFQEIGKSELNDMPKYERHTNKKRKGGA